MRLVFALLSVVPLICFGQKATIAWSKDSIRIGEPSRLTIRIENVSRKPDFSPFGQVVASQLKLDSAGLTAKSELELLKPLSDTLDLKNKTWTAKLELTAWDTGTYVLPTFTFSFPDTNFNLQPKELTVIFKKQTVADGLQETFVDIEEDPFWWLKKYWWLGFIPLAVVIVLLIRKRLEVKKVKLVSLRERSLRTLDALRKQEYWLKGRTEEHYTEFSFLLRSFLSARFALHLMERTSYETMELLEKQNITREALNRIGELITLSDKVKFAQETPQNEVTERALEKFEELIIEISPLEITE